MILEEIKKTPEFFSAYPSVGIDILRKKIGEIRLGELILLYPFENWQEESLSISEHKKQIIEFFELYIKEVWLHINKEKGYYSIFPFRLSFAITLQVPIFIKIDCSCKKKMKQISEKVEDLFSLTLKEIENQYQVKFDISFSKEIKKINEYYLNSCYNLKDLNKIYEIYKKNEKLRNIVNKNKIFMFYLYPTFAFNNNDLKAKEKIILNLKMLEKKVYELNNFLENNKEILNKLIYIQNFEKAVKNINDYLNKLDTKNYRTLNNLINLKEEIKDIKNKKERLDKLIKTLERIINN